MYNAELDDITCWQGHQQEQWNISRQTMPNGDTVEAYESKCHCGEIIRVYFQNGKWCESDYWY